MDELLDSIYNKISRANTLTSLIDNPSEQRSEPGREKFEHIFYDLMEFLSPMSKSQEITLQYYFQTYQECFLFTKGRRLNIAGSKLLFIDQKLSLNFDRKTNLALEALYFPVKAYYFNIIKEHKAAIDLLSRSIKNFEEFKQWGLKEVDWAILEQKLNICKVHFDSGDPSTAILATKAILNSLDKILIEHSTDKENDNQKSTEYFLNSIVLASLKLPENQITKTIEEILLYLNETNFDFKKNENINFGITILVLILSKNYPLFLLEIENNFEKFIKLPGIWQTLSYCFLILAASEASYSKKPEFSTLIINILSTRKLKQDLFNKILFSLKNHIPLKNEMHLP